MFTKIRNDIRQYSRYGQWYESANQELRKLFGKDAKLFAALLAATSPCQQVKRNFRLAKIAFDTRDYPSGILPCVAGNIDRALKGQPLSGRKVRAFAQNLQGNLNVVTVDVWMYRYFGLKATDKNYTRIERLVYFLAKRYELKPAELQAILWTAIRADSGKYPTSFASGLSELKQGTFWNL